MLRGKRESGGCCEVPGFWNRAVGSAVVALALACALVAQSAQAQPINDNCSGARVLTTGIPLLGSSANATGTDMTGLCGIGDSTDVWFTWTSTCTANVTVSSCGSAFDTTLSVFDAPCPGSFDFACADDECGLQSQLVFSATSGTTYLIRLAGTNGATGNYTIVVTCPPVGACCIGSGLCQDSVTEEDCTTNFLGLFLGAGTDCAGGACSMGACCAPSGCSDVMGFNDCTELGAIYQGDGTTCATTVCPAFGACCGFSDGMCLDMTQADCDFSGGNYLGDGTDCVTDGAACAMGACCTPTAGCQMTDSVSCGSMGGTFFGGGTSCLDRICNDDCGTATMINAIPYTTQIDNSTAMNGPEGQRGSCDGNITTVALDVWYRWTPDTDCEATASWTPLEGQDNILIVWKSLSANPDDDCNNMEFVSQPGQPGIPGPNEVDCQECTDNTQSCPDPGVAEVSTFFAQAGTTYWFQCAQQGSAPDAGGLSEFSLDCTGVTGACCIDGVCFDQFETQCAENDGIFLGQGTDCATSGVICSTGACCLLDGTCSDGVSEEDCLLMDGQYAGGATECSTTACQPAGACCTGGVCDVTFRNDCLNGGGEFLGTGSVCGPNSCDGACCDGNSCTIQNQADCVDAGEVFFGPGSVCEEVTCPGYGGIQLNYNWNGISHPAERGDPNRLTGFRSIGDRGIRLDTSTSVGGGTNQVLSGNILYTFEARPDVVDTVLIGRRSVSPPWDDVVDADDIGVQPTWDPTNGTGVVDSSTTTLNPPRLLDDNFELGVLSHGTQGGGLYQMTLAFTDSTEISVVIQNPDWFANGNGVPAPPSAGVATQALLTPAPLSAGDGFDSVAGFEFQDPGAPLNLVQAVVTRASIMTAFSIDVSGKSLESITFDLWTGSTNSAGGIYAVSMAVPGACCLADGTCSEGLRTDCTASGGIYQGDGSDCVTSAGNCAIGACCFTDGTCQDSFSENDCIAASGHFQGTGTMCATSPCPPTGGCCDVGLGCTVEFEVNCNGSGGTYLGDGTTCDFGCDCNANTTIDVFEITAATDCDGNFILDECETPDPSMVGACCVSGNCSLQSSADCDTAGGIYFGDCTVCSDIICPGPGYVDLDFNWNGIVHPGESNAPDDPDGYRSISDRGLIFGTTTSLGGTTGILTRGNLTYQLQMLGKPHLDIIHIGNRRNAWQPTANGDNIGIQPNWDPSTGTGQNVPSATSTFPPTPPLNSQFELGFLFQTGNGGGTIQTTLGFTDSSTVTFGIRAPDWFANANTVATPPLPGVASQVLVPGPLSGGDGWFGASDNDRGNPDQPLNVVESVVTASSLFSGLGFDVTGRQLESITFDGWVSTNGVTDAGCAIVAASYYNPTATCTCAGDVSGDNAIDGADIQGFVDCLLGGGGDCSCADVDGMNGADVGDIAGFVTNLLTVGPACP